MGPSGGTSTGPSSGTRKRLEEEEQSNEWRYGATVVSNEALRLELARTKQVKRELVKETADLKSGSEQMKEEVEEVEEDVVVLDVELVRIKDFWGQEFRELRRKEETLGEKVESLSKEVQDVKSDCKQMQLHAMTHVRKLVTIEGEPPSEEAIRVGVAYFVQFLKRESFPQLQAEAACALNDIMVEKFKNVDAVIGSGTAPILAQLLHSPSDDLLEQAARALANIACHVNDVCVVVESGAVSILVELLGSQSDKVREQAVLALGNIADKSPTLRDLVLEQNTLNSLLELLNEGSKLSMRRIASWTFRRFCDGELQPDQFVQLKDALPALARLV